MYLKPIQFYQAEGLRNFLDQYQKQFKEKKNPICRAYQGELYLTEVVKEYYKSGSVDKKEDFKHHNKSLLKPASLNTLWSLVYLPNFETFIQQWNGKLYPRAELDLGLLNEKTINYVKPQFKSQALFNTLRSDLEKLKTHLEAFKKLNPLRAELLSTNLTDNELLELSQKSPNYLPSLYKDFLRITFIQQVKLKQLLNQALMDCDKENLRTSLQDWIREIDSNNSLIIEFLENAIKRMQANQALKNSAKIRAQQLIGHELNPKIIEEKIRKAEVLKQDASSNKQIAHKIMPTAVWIAFSLFLITLLVSAALIFFVELTLPVLITFGVLYLLSATILGFTSPTTTIKFLSQKLEEHFESDLHEAETLLLDAKFLENYFKLDEDYLGIDEVHKPMIEAIASDLKEMERFEREALQPEAKKISLSTLGLFSNHLDTENKTSLIAEDNNAFII